MKAKEVLTKTFKKSGWMLDDLGPETLADETLAALTDAGFQLMTPAETRELEGHLEELKRKVEEWQQFAVPVMEMLQGRRAN